MTGRAITGLGEVTAIAHVTTRQDLSRWTRARAGAPGITWSVLAGDGGTMLIIEHAHDRAAAPGAARVVAPRKAAA